MPDPTPAILEASNRFRAQLLRRERTAASQIVHYYGATWRRLQPQIDALQAEVAAMQAAGEDAGPGKLWRLERMEAIQHQVEQELNEFAQYASGIVVKAEQEAIAAAERNARDLIQAAFPTDVGIDISFARMPREATNALIGHLMDGSPLADLITRKTGKAASGFMATMVTGIAAGWNPRKLADRLRSEFGMGLTDALRIARTEQMRAYHAATLYTYQQSDVVTTWERHAQLGPRTCLACLMLDGKRYKLNEPMDDHPNGRCALLPITKTYAELGIDAPEPDFSREMGHDWFLRQDEATQREMMGAGRFEAWKDGKFRLEDIPKLVKNSVWGDSWQVRSLKDLLDRDLSAWLLRDLEHPGAGALSARLGLKRRPIVDWRRAGDYQKIQAKEQIIQALAERTGITNEKINAWIAQWSETSNDDDMRSLAIQRAAADLFNVSLSDFTQGKIDNLMERLASGESGARLFPLMPDEQQRNLLRAMYEHTQEELAAVGYKLSDTIKLWRGVGIPDEVARQYHRGDMIEITGNVLESWSLGSDIGFTFADNARNRGESAFLLEFDVPVEAIIGSARTGFGCLSEGEFVTIGVRGWTKIIEVF